MDAIERAHDAVISYAGLLGLRQDVLAVLRVTAPEVPAHAVWCVQTQVWWERRWFRHRGARETAREHDEYVFDGLSVPIVALPDRWEIPVDRPGPFRSLAKRLNLNVGVDHMEMDIAFGVEAFTQTFGDPGFPVALRDKLAVQERFQGIDSVPVVARRGGAPYREASLPSDRGGVPSDVMESIRAFVREIGMPGYTDRIHGWRTLLQGGPIAHLRYALPSPLPTGVRAFDAIVIEAHQLVYAPDLAEAADVTGID